MNSALMRELSATSKKRRRIHDFGVVFAETAQWHGFQDGAMTGWRAARHKEVPVVPRESQVIIQSRLETPSARVIGA